MNLEQAKQVLESLQELTVDPIRFAWGPSYAFAKQRRKAAIKIMNKVVKKLEPKTPVKPEKGKDE